MLPLLNHRQPSTRRRWTQAPTSQTPPVSNAMKQQPRRRCRYVRQRDGFNDALSPIRRIWFHVDIRSLSILMCCILLITYAVTTPTSVLSTPPSFYYNHTTTSSTNSTNKTKPSTGTTTTAESSDAFSVQTTNMTTSVLHKPAVDVALVTETSRTTPDRKSVV